MGATPLSRRPKLTTRSVRMLTDADIATVILFIYFFIAADASKIQRWVFFESEREGKKGRGATDGRRRGGGEGQGREQQQRQRRPRTPDPKSY